MRLLYWTWIFLLTALVTHLAYVLFAPRLGARALMQEVGRKLEKNRLKVLSPTMAARIIRHPADMPVYAACLFSLAEHDVILRGQNLRGMWVLTVYSPRGDAIYTISDRHLPSGPIHIRFQSSRGSGKGDEIALPRLQARKMVVPLASSEAMMVLEAWPWHPGQRPLLQEQLSSLECTPATQARALSSGPRGNPARGNAQEASTPAPAIVTPRPRQKR